MATSFSRWLLNNGSEPTTSARPLVGQASRGLGRNRARWMRSIYRAAIESCEQPLVSSIDWVSAAVIVSIDEQWQSRLFRERSSHNSPQSLRLQHVAELAHSGDVTPVGRLRLVTRPNLIGSAPTLTTTGIVRVADLATNAAAFAPATMMVTWRSTRSAASAGSRSV